jgi:hypothetical protein
MMNEIFKKKNCGNVMKLYSGIKPFTTFTSSMVEMWKECCWNADGVAVIDVECSSWVQLMCHIANTVMAICVRCGCSSVWAIEIETAASISIAD